ncbi:hypothetical protein FBZ93_111156 [Bradyrhizobium macuxiense]|uniref:Uncharacterized protein n=1 Tax=Bradyrhizobium macuxiense TaxID=1755647 RepID=A0A560LCS8_9BRAD|nr:hypothetical protein FBZ93_111156 [Bradyrhizobium macuxiense]
MAHLEFDAIVVFQWRVDGHVIQCAGQPEFGRRPENRN